MINVKTAMLFNKATGRDNPRNLSMVMLTNIITTLMEPDADKKPFLDAYISEPNFNAIKSELRSVII